jgi:DNA repair photolyase
MSGVTDCYQPVERRLRLTRKCLEVLAEFRNPVSIVTKNYLVTRDLDLLRELAAHHAVMVHLSINSLNRDLASRLEPRASSPHQRLAVDGPELSTTNFRRPEGPQLALGI